MNTTADQQPPETTDYQEARAALFRAAQLLEQAQAEIASAEAFAETGTTGMMRDRTIAETKAAHLAVLTARRNVDNATFETAQRSM